MKSNVTLKARDLSRHINRSYDAYDAKEIAGKIAKTVGAFRVDGNYFETYTKDLVKDLKKWYGDSDLEDLVMDYCEAVQNEIRFNLLFDLDIKNNDTDFDF